MTSPTSLHAEAVRSKLTRILGADKGDLLFAEVMRELSLTSIATSEDVMRVAQALEGRGGMAALIGGALTVHAQLHGAKARR